VVDDEERIRNGCCRVLSEEGFEVHTAECGEAGLKMIRDRHFDIILLDLMMPSLSGFDVLAQVKSLHPDAVIIVISGYATLEHSIEAMKKGAFDFIPKPFTPEQLRLLVAKALEYTRTLRDIANEKSRMRVLINRLSDGVMATDNKKQIVLANPAFLRMVGYRGESAVGNSVEQVAGFERLKVMIDRVLAMPGEEFAELAEELDAGNGSGQPERVLNARCVPFRDRIGRTLGTITLLQDVTAIKHMDQIKSNFVSMVAHEIRNPLSSVLMQLQVVLDGLAGEVSSKQMEILARVSGKVKDLVTLSSELLDIARIESGLISQEKEQLNLAEIIVDQVEFHRKRAEADAISMEVENLPAPLLVVANRRNMEEVLSNLITNAIKYTPQGGAIRISAAIEGDYVRVDVKDTGFGISKEDQEKIFNPFYRAKDEKNRFITGTGLGLSIVKSIIDAHNGIIQVESEPGQGSLFRVHLPLVMSQESPAVDKCAASLPNS
jgi:PAS domain S-box-containing protein